MKIIRDPYLVLDLPLYLLDGKTFTSKDMYGHLCTVTGALWRSDGRLFDGATTTIACGNGVALQISNKITLEAWVLLDAVVAANYQGIIYKLGTKIGYTLGVPANTQQVEGGFHNGSDWTSKVVSTDDITLATWYHLVYTYDKVTHRIYFNGIENNTKPDDTGGTADTTHDLHIGSDSGSATFWGGNIGEVRIYSRALTPQEIQHNYLATRWRFK